MSETGLVQILEGALLAAGKTLTVAQLADAGAKRISIGGALARIAYASLLKPSHEMNEAGSFGWLSQLAGSRELGSLLS